MIVAGIDAGSRTVKLVLMDPETSQIIAYIIDDQGVRQEEKARQLFDKLLVSQKLDIDSVKYIVATGYGRHLIGFADDAVTEITCHARGVLHLEPDARSIIEIGGQDSKVISLDSDGRIKDFSMNDRCAAGTGRFLEMVATQLGVHLQDFGPLVEKSKEPSSISSMCVVFAETEIVGLLATGIPSENIVVGVQDAISSRVVAMLGRNFEKPVVFAGGVALVPGMKEALSRTLGGKVIVPNEAQITGAIGAALIASQRVSG